MDTKEADTVEYKGRVIVLTVQPSGDTSATVQTPDVCIMNNISRESALHGAMQWIDNQQGSTIACTQPKPPQPIVGEIPPPDISKPRRFR